MHSNNSAITNCYGLPTGRFYYDKTEISRILNLSTHEEFENYLYESKNYLTVPFFIVIVKRLKYV
mgnify:CR=1 FL=1